MTERPAVIASVPGKLILMGEHAAVYGRPALVAALGLRAEIRVAPGQEGVSLSLPDLGWRELSSWGPILDLARRAGARWRRGERTAPPPGGDPAYLVKLALGEVALDLGDGPPPPLAVRVESRIPVGSGFGSSAAIAVGVVGAALAFLGASPEPERVDRLALEVERRQHGRPSGVDHRTVLAGGVVAARRRGDEGMEIQALAPRSRVLTCLQVLDTGAPRETTGEVVEAVSRRRASDPAGFERLLDDMEGGVDALRGQLEAEREEPDLVVELIRDYERCLETMGVVPAEVRAAIRRIEASGAAAKISGAGSLGGPAAGCLLVYRPPARPPVPEAALAGFRALDVELGSPGLALERAS